MSISKTQNETGISHIADSEESEAGRVLSLGLGGGCNWLIISSACNINKHVSITKSTEGESQIGMTHMQVQKNWKTTNLV